MKPSERTEPNVMQTAHADAAAAIVDGRAWRGDAAVSARLGDYYELTKPRMNFLVVLTTMVGFYMASGGAVPWLLLCCTLVGTLLTASAAAVFNQYLERSYDALMPRTCQRPLPAGRLAPSEALVYGLGLLAAGLGCLVLLVNPLTGVLGAATVATYVLVYTPMKRRSTLNTIIGAVPGAIPPMMGWSARQGSLSIEAFTLFAILFLWQTPHFLAIATMYRQDYARGGFKMLPVLDRDLRMTGRQIVVYALALIPISVLPWMVHMSGAIYLGAAVILGVAFLGFAASAAWSRARCQARRLFLASIVYLPVLMALMVIDKL